MLGGSNTMEGYFNCPAFESTQEQPPSRPRVLSVSLIFWNGRNNIWNEFVMHTWFWRSLFQLVIFWPKLARVLWQNKRDKLWKVRTLNISPEGGRGRVLPIMSYLGRLRICHLGQWKGPKGPTFEFYGFIKSRKRSIFVIDSYLNANAFTAVKRDAKF